MTGDPVVHLPDDFDPNRTAGTACGLVLGQEPWDADVDCCIDGPTEVDEITCPECLGSPYFLIEKPTSTVKPHGTVDVEIAQMGELFDHLRGHITGAQVIVEAPDGHRYGLLGLRWEPTLEHPQGRLVLVTSDCVHWSEDCDPEVAERG